MSLIPLCVCVWDSKSDSIHTAFITPYKKLFKPSKGIFSHYKLGLFEGLGFMQQKDFKN